MSDNIQKVINAISEVSAVCDMDGITLDVQQELVPRKIVGGAPMQPTGREILIIKIPFNRTPEFVRRQLDGVREQIKQMEFALTVARGEAAQLENEANPKLA
jgi:hypothetical protein